MLAISAQLAGAGATIQDAVAHIESDPARAIEGKEQFREWMQELADRTLADVADTHFDIPEPIRRIDCRIAPTQDGGIYYTAAVGGLQPPRRDVVVGPRRRRRRSTPGVRSRPSTTRAGPGPSPPVRSGRLPLRRPQPLAAPACAGSPATARAGRSTPSG